MQSTNIALRHLSFFSFRKYKHKSNVPTAPFYFLQSTNHNIYLLRIFCVLGVVGETEDD